MEVLVLLVIFFSTLSSFFFHTYTATDTITVNQSIGDGETIVSASGGFELGFFSPLANSASNRRYLGIWHRFSNETVVWVANRETPLNDTSGILQVTSQGNLAILSSNNFRVWSSSSTNTLKQVQNPIAQILDTGNFVVREADDNNEDNYIWQSFDYIGDTALPGTRYGRNLVTGMDWNLKSWKSPSDPSFGEATKWVDVRGYPQIYLKLGENIVFRSGPWNGLNFGGAGGLKPHLYSYQLVHTEEEIYLKYEVVDKSVFTKMTLDNRALMHQFIWNNNTRKWDLDYTSYKDKCDSYALCGSFGICNISNSPMCSCLEGFMPKFPRDWESGNWSGGCARKNDLVCGTGGTFHRIDVVKLPDSSKSWFNKSMNLSECERECLKNCSCTAYSTLDILAGVGCLFWSGDLLDTRIYDGKGQSFYLRLADSELGLIDRGKSFGKKKVIEIVASCAVFVGILMVGTILCIYKKKRSKQGMTKSRYRMFFGNKQGKGDAEFPLFDLTTVVRATKNFLEANKLGEGGFGAVYKGTLIDGQEIAVKRLSKSSAQGLAEFKNEVILIAKLQHINLVRLLGCCIEGDENLLIYEFMPNKSLNYFIFDPERRTLLDWNMRSRIISGIARGLLYLHQDSRLRVIHRDLKASNILLDANMTPKISDFGLARMIVGDQTEAKTNKVFGTYGYMSPEYAINGLFSTKSDVFSFGVLVLEIVSGERNRVFSSPQCGDNLLGHAWKLWKEERPLELVYDTLGDSNAESEVKRCIQVGLLCVQPKPKDRPKMSSVVSMLGSESPLPQPKQPPFFTETNIPDSDSKTCSANEMSTSTLDPR